jgi:undecaprenyl-diphosphatase
VGAIVGVVVAYRRREEIAAWFRAREHHVLVRPLFVVARPVYRSLVRPVARVLAPEVRFLMDHLTPGGTGLKLFTAMAVAATGAYVLVTYVSVLSDSAALTPLDRELLDVSADLRTDVGVDIAKVVTELGAFVTVAMLVAVAGIVLASRRQWWAFVLLVIGLAALKVGVDVTTAAIDRPRPGGSLVETSNSAFPSGHAAYATVWVAVAVALTSGRGVARQATIVVLAVALAAVIGLTRIYLRAHYWSDVAGGWALGAAVFGLLATIALIVELVRNNGSGTEPASAGSSG